MAKSRRKLECCEENDIIHKIGEEWKDPGQCNRKVCRSAGNILHYTCPQVDVPDGCFLKQGDCNQGFPHCCPSAECPGGLQQYLQNLRENAEMSSSSSSSSSSEDEDLEDLYDEPDDADEVQVTQYTSRNPTESKTTSNEEKDHYATNTQIKNKIDQKASVLGKSDRSTENQKEIKRFQERSEEKTQTIKSSDIKQETLTRVDHPGDNFESKTDTRGINKNEIGDRQENSEVTRNTKGDIDGGVSQDMAKSSSKLSEKAVDDPVFLDEGKSNIDQDPKITEHNELHGSNEQKGTFNSDSNKNTEDYLGHDEKFLELLKEIDSRKDVPSFRESKENPAHIVDDPNIDDSPYIIDGINVTDLKGLGLQQDFPEPETEVLYELENKEGFIYDPGDSEGFLNESLVKDVTQNEEPTEVVNSSVNLTENTTDYNNINDNTKESFIGQEITSQSEESTLRGNLEENIHSYDQTEGLENVEGLNHESSEPNDFIKLVAEENERVEHFEEEAEETQNTNIEEGFIHLYKDNEELVNSADVKDGVYEPSNSDIAQDEGEVDTKEEYIQSPSDFIDVSQSVSNFTEGLAHSNDDMELVAYPTDDPEVLMFRSTDAERVFNAANEQEEDCRSQDSVEVHNQGAEGYSNINTLDETDEYINNVEEPEESVPMSREESVEHLEGLEIKIEDDVENNDFHTESNDMAIAM